MQILIKRMFQYFNYKNCAHNKIFRMLNYIKTIKFYI
jgi:hypothetical protein